MNDKKSVAFVSIFASLGLTLFKLLVGILSGSLGILAEAIHSMLDMLATVITYFAVRFADKPADVCHHFGHGKIENFSALIETVLLWVACAWIVQEAIRRLINNEGHVEITWWTFAIVIVSIVVDFWRSRALYKAAKKHHSPALEADALHFSTDLWSSIVVLCGLIAICIGKFTSNPEIFQKADAVAALGVVILTIVVSIKLVKKAYDVLTDRAPKEITTQIEQILSTVNIISWSRLRVRQSGMETFIDFTIVVPADLTLEQAHDKAHLIENMLKEKISHADIMVHVDPRRMRK